MNEKKATPKNEAAPKELRVEFRAGNGGNGNCNGNVGNLGNDGDGSNGGNDAAAQRRRTLNLLRGGPKSTIQLRRDGDILAPAARILELKQRGFDILTQWVQQATDSGKLHRVALYVLLRETGGQA